MGMMSEAISASAAKAKASRQSFYPAATIRCDGPRLFRSQTARDVACLLDVDPAVHSWVCTPEAFDVDGHRHIPDFALVDTHGGRSFLDAPDRGDVKADDVSRAVLAKTGRPYSVMSDAELRSGYRLRNAKDLLRYGNYTVTLGDRIRLLAALEELGSMTVSECLQAFQEIRPMAASAPSSSTGSSKSIWTPV